MLFASSVKRWVWIGLLLVQGFGTALLAARPVTGACVNEAWPVHLNGNGSKNQGLFTRCGPDGSVYVAGTVGGLGRNANTTLIRYDSTGSLQWITVYDSRFNYRDVPCGLHVDTNGDAYLAGTSDQDPTTGVASEVFLVKYSAAGQQQWLREYDPGPYGDEARSLMVTANGDCFVHLEYARTGAHQAVTLKYDASAQLRWESRHDLGYAHFAGSLLEGEPGTLYSLSTATESGPNVQLVKYSQATGAKLWTRTLSNNTGAIGCYGTGGPLVAMHSSQPSKTVVTRFTPEGDVAWTAQLPAEYLGGIAATPAGDFYVSGSAVLARLSGSGALLWSVNRPATGSWPLKATADGDVVIAGPGGTVRMSGSGAVMWSQPLTTTPTNSWMAEDLDFDAAGNTYIAGEAWAGTVERWDMVTLKYDLSGQTVPKTPAPGGLLARAMTLSQIDLNWTEHSANETGFVLERSAPDTAFAEIATLPANTTSYSDYGLEQDTTYTYRLRALAEECPSGYSSSTFATTPALLPATPAAPVVVTPDALRGQKMLDVSWVVPPVTKEIFLERANGENAPGGFSLVASFPPAVSAYSDGGLQPGSGYTYRVRGRNSAGYSAYSPTTNARTRAAAGGKLQVPASVSFPATRVGASRTKPLKLRNLDKTKPLRVEILQAPTAADFQISGLPLAVTIPPRGSSSIPLVFTPQAPGKPSATLTLRSDDPTTTTAYVSLKGKAQAARLRPVAPSLNR